MVADSIMYLLVGTWWMAGTVYLFFCPEADLPGSKPLGVFRSEGYLAHDGEVLNLCMVTQKDKGRVEGWR